MQEGAAEPSQPVLKAKSVFVARYEVVRCIKAGGMGAVYEVVDLQTRRRRALKVMLPTIVADADMRARFRLEATVAADVESEHIVEVFDAGVEPETQTPFLVMELLKGEELGATLSRRGPLGAEEVVALLHQAALALDRTHAIGIVHRDLKPENLFVTRRDDGSARLKLLDFGIAKVVEQGTGGARTTRSVGTPLYMSPEQIEGEGAIDHRADLYALGHIAFALLTGEAYWEPESRAANAVYPVLVRVMKGPKEAASVRAERRGVVLPSAFDAWFGRATALAAADRFDSASELVEELARVLGVDPPVRLAPPPAPRETPHAAPTNERVAPSPASNTQGAVAADPAPAGTQRRSMGVAAWASGAIVALVIAAVLAVRSFDGSTGSTSVPASGGAGSSEPVVAAAAPATPTTAPTTSAVASPMASVSAPTPAASSPPASAPEQPKKPSMPTRSRPAASATGAAPTPGSYDPSDTR